MTASSGQRCRNGSKPRLGGTTEKIGELPKALQCCAAHVQHVHCVPLPTFSFYAELEGSFICRVITDKYQSDCVVNHLLPTTVQQPIAVPATLMSRSALLRYAARNIVLIAGNNTMVQEFA